jgi:hypothetical protein
VKKLLSNILSFLFFFFSFTALLELIYEDYRNNIDYIISPLFSDSLNVETLIIGASHTQSLGALEIFEEQKTYNASIGGQDLLHSYLILRSCIDKQPNLKTVLMELEYHSLGFSFSKFNQNWKERQYFPFTNYLSDSSLTNYILAKSNFFRSNRDINFLINKIKPLKSHKAYTANEDKNYLNNSLIPLVKMDKNDKIDCVKRAIEHTKIKYNKSIVKDNEIILNNVIDLCENNKINLMFINTPKKKCYVKEYLSCENINQDKERIYNIVNKSNINYLDFLEQNFFTENSFRDADHLNQKGVDVLKNLLLNTLKNNN